MGDLTLFEALTGGAFDRLNWQYSGEFDQVKCPRVCPGGIWAVLELTGTLRVLGWWWDFVLFAIFGKKGSSDWGPYTYSCRDISSRREISGYKHNVLSEADDGAFKLDRLMLGWRLCTLFWSKFSEFASQGEYFYFTTVFVASYCRIPGHSFASHRIWVVSFVFRVVLSSVGIYEWVPKWVIKSLPIFGFGL